MAGVDDAEQRLQALLDAHVWASIESAATDMLERFPDAALPHLALTLLADLDPPCNLTIGEHE
jgi:hypothetical protein